MKKKIAILGSTGSIGKNLLQILLKEKKKIDIYLLTANKNYKELINQSKKFNVKNIIITDKYSFKKFKKINKDKKIKVFDNFDSFNKIFNKKIDYVMSSIVGIEGLYPTLKIIKYANKIAIANKESIICGWNLIQRELKKYNTEFLPVDSEHFSVWYGIKYQSVSNIHKVYLTASGGSLLNIPKKRYKNLGLKEIVKHPNWKMGKKISVDSSTMMNKVFEVIEAKKIFNISYKKISIIIHPKSYIHAIIIFNDGMIKLISHKTTMKIPIANTLNGLLTAKYALNKTILKLNLNNLNKPELHKISQKKFPFVKIINQLPKKNSLFETLLVAANDEFVRFFLERKITYTELLSKLVRFISKKEFVKYKRIEPKKITDILEFNQKIRNKINF
jgi:1-deoxy-D-xylulose-5-phosphate reductoisomerase